MPPGLPQRKVAVCVVSKHREPEVMALCLHFSNINSQKNRGRVC
jgi:hypothetical protein